MNTPSVKIVADSIDMNGSRITTFVLSYHRWILAELNTHRIFSRSTASSRAIPLTKTVKAALEDPAMPVSWVKNQPGMQASENVDEATAVEAEAVWRDLAIYTANACQKLANLGIHKQIANRPLEWTQFTNTILTSTEWNNFFGLRTHKDAQPEFQAFAKPMLEQYKASTPRMLQRDEWHLPLVSDEEKSLYPLEDLKKFSVARCARVSTKNHDNSNPDPQKDRERHDSLLASGHMSPFEHQATPGKYPLMMYDNLRGYMSYRYTIPNQHNITGFSVSEDIARFLDLSGIM